MNSRALVIVALAMAALPSVALGAGRSYEAEDDRQARRQAQEEAGHQAAEARRDLERDQASLQEQRKNLQARFELEQRELKEDTQRKKEQIQAKARQQSEDLEAKARDERQKLEARYRREADQLAAHIEGEQDKLGQRQERLKEQAEDIRAESEAKRAEIQRDAQRAEHADHQEAAWWKRDEDSASRSDAGASRDAERQQLSQLSGTITAIDSDQRRLTLREDGQPGPGMAAAPRAGQSRDLHLDPQATVIYGNDQLQVEDLQVGDRVRVTVDMRDGQPKVRTINVQQTKS